MTDNLIDGEASGDEFSIDRIIWFSLGTVILVVISGVTKEYPLLPLISDTDQDIPRVTEYEMKSDEILVDVNLYDLWSSEEKFTMHTSSSSPNTKISAVIYHIPCTDQQDMLWEPKNFFYIDESGYLLSNESLSHSTFAEVTISMSEPRDVSQSFCLWIKTDGNVDLTVTRTTEAGVKPAAISLIVWGVWLLGAASLFFVFFPEEFREWYYSDDD
jgi:hypothetical protein